MSNNFKNINFRKIKQEIVYFFRAFSLLFVFTLIFSWADSIVFYRYREFITYGLLLVSIFVILILIVYPSISEFLQDAIGTKDLKKQAIYLLIASSVFSSFIYLCEIGMFSTSLMDALFMGLIFVSYLLVILYLFNLHKRKVYKLLIILLFGLILNMPIPYTIYHPGATLIELIARYFYGNAHNFYGYYKLIQTISTLILYVVVLILIIRKKFYDQTKQPLKKAIFNKLLLTLFIIFLISLSGWFFYPLPASALFLFSLFFEHILYLVLFMLFFMVFFKIAYILSKNIRSFRIQVFLIIFVFINYYLTIGFLTTVITKKVTCNITTKIVQNQEYKYIPFYPIIKSAIFPIEIFDYNMYFQNIPYKEFTTNYYEFYNYGLEETTKDYIQAWIAIDYCGLNVTIRDIPRHYWRP